MCLGHLDTVYAVACSPSNPHIFVSASEVAKLHENLF